MARTAPSPSLAGIPVFAVVDENRARAAAGITMAVGAVAFAEANFEHHFVPIRIVTIVFAVDFLLRVTIGLDRSPVGVVSTWIARRRPPEPVSARPKRFAWTLGLAMSAAMAVITNLGVHGVLPRTICLLCLALMWLESVLGLCLGCEIHGVLARRGWARSDDGFEICVGGACARR